MIGPGISARIALAALAAAGVGLSILALGVTIIGAQTFTAMMIAAGDTAEHARAMYDQSVTRVVVIAFLVAFTSSVLLAVNLGRRLGRPLAEVGAAARRVALGDYATRVPRRGPDELAGLADSFNQMAADLELQERVRRDFIANAAHELRTPLTNLQGYLEALRDGVMKADRATYESLLDEADRLVRLSRSLDDLARGDAALTVSDVADIDLADIVRTAADRIRPAAERSGIGLQVDVPGRLIARGNPDHLAQILANLLSNALRYRPTGGRIMIRIRPGPADVLVSVSNTSAPIPSQDLARVFERFYRVEKSRDRAKGGAGIGLAIVKQLVEVAGRRFGAESYEGEAHFWFRLPA